MEHFIEYISDQPPCSNRRKPYLRKYFAIYWDYYDVQKEITWENGAHDAELFSWKSTMDTTQKKVSHDGGLAFRECFSVKKETGNKVFD